MNLEFKVAKGWRLFIYLVAPLLIMLFAYLGLMPLFQKDIDGKALVFLLPLSIAMILFLIYGLIDVNKAKLIVQEDGLVQISAFKRKELPYFHAKGFRVDDRNICVFSAETGFPNLKISIYNERIDELTELLSERLIDLDEQNFIADEQEILYNETFGATPAERATKLQEARNISRALNLTGVISGAWTLFYPHPYWLVTFIDLLLPLILLIVLYRYKGLIKIDEKSSSAFLSVVSAWILSSSTLALRGLMDFELIDYHKLWLPVISATFIIAALLIAFTDRSVVKAKRLVFKTATFVFFASIYSYGACINLNCFQDKSTPEHFTARVLNKTIHTGKYTTYNLELEKWGSLQQSNNVTVTATVYKDVKIGEAVNVYLKQGGLQAAWFFVSK